VRRVHQIHPKASREQDVFDVLRARVAGAAVRVHELLDFCVHEMRGRVSRVWVSREEREREHVYAGRGGRVRREWRQRESEEKIFREREVRRGEVSETGEQRDEQDKGVRESGVGG